jgi:hypothetical protein
MSLTATQIAHLNGADEAHQQAGVGTLLASLESSVTTLETGSVIAAGTYTVVADDDTAGTVDIDSGLATGASAMVQIQRAGVNVLEDAVVTVAAGVITLTDGGATYALTADDVVKYIVF